MVLYVYMHFNFSLTKAIICKCFSLTEIVRVWFSQSRTNRPRYDWSSASSNMYTHYSDYSWLWPCDILQKTDVTLNMHLIVSIQIVPNIQSDEDRRSSLQKA